MLLPAIEAKEFTHFLYFILWSSESTLKIWCFLSEKFTTNGLVNYEFHILVDTTSESA